MRFLTVIFTVYIMLLAIVPCHCDTANGDCSETKLVSEIAVDNHTNYKYVDLCTPFCLRPCSSEKLSRQTIRH